MDQAKIGAFLKAQRRKKGITQAQLAGRFGVSDRTVSRWETGRTLPDFALLIELARFYDVTIEEILQGRQEDTMDEKEETLAMGIADYTAAEKARLTRRMHLLFLLGAAAMLLALVCQAAGLTAQPFGDAAASFGLGAAFGILLVGALFTSPAAGRLLACKRRLLQRIAGRQ